MDPGTGPSEAVSYLDSLINKTLHVHTSDGRIFVGQMKCTDNERNIILAVTQEYRRKEGKSELFPGKPESAMKKRFVGLVVVPGAYIRKIEAE